LCWIIRNGASVCHERQVSFVPVGGRTVRGWEFGMGGMIGAEPRRRKGSAQTIDVAAEPETGATIAA
jgi:hypothetical protein